LKAIDISIAEGDSFLSTETLELRPRESCENALLIRTLSQATDSLLASVALSIGTASEAGPAIESRRDEPTEVGEFSATPKLLDAVDRHMQEHHWPQATRSFIESINQQRKTGLGISLAVEVVDSKRITEMNMTFRDKNSATNVLSFPANDDVEGDEFQQLVALMTEQGMVSEESDSALNPRSESCNEVANIPLGDIVLCRSVIETEARAQFKAFEAHWVHLATHGLLHLFGFSHHDESSASCMESLEISLLEGFGLGNPYIERASLDDS